MKQHIHYPKKIWKIGHPVVLTQAAAFFQHPLVPNSRVESIILVEKERVIPLTESETPLEYRFVENSRMEREFFIWSFLLPDSTFGHFFLDSKRPKINLHAELNLFFSVNLTR